MAEVKATRLAFFKDDLVDHPGKVMVVIVNNPTGQLGDIETFKLCDDQASADEFAAAWLGDEAEVVMIRVKN